MEMTEGATVLRNSALSLQFHTVLLEALLTGIALAMAHSWSETILACVEQWMDEASAPLQHFISSLVITSFALGFAVVAVFALAAPKTIVRACGHLSRGGAAKRLRMLRHRRESSRRV